ncbi:MAG: hypothetical protein AAGA83_06520 [Cyanobacteria bacterium P01_F01_bin.116]
MINSKVYRPSKQQSTLRQSTGPKLPQESSELRQLQKLLLGDDLESLSQPNVNAVAEILPEAILTAQKQQKTMTSAAVPTIEAAIQASVNQNANVLSEALFPIIGPATRKSISAAIGNLVQSLNQTLEHSLSPRSFRWRMEAWQTGKSFAEIVLLRTLVYQVEQVLLIHKETGLILQHVVKDAVTVQDPDMVSAMLTAIQDFVQDSFSVSQSEGLDTLELGDLNLWIEAGPQAILACVIRGTAPQELRTLLCENLEKIHLLFNQQLQTFDGDQAMLLGSVPYLQDCLQARFKASQTESTAVSKWQKIRRWGTLATIVVALAVWIGMNRQAHQRWLNYVDRVDQQPGIVVINAQHKGGKYYLTGLRDPLATDPAQFLDSAQLDPHSVIMSWEPYFSADPAFMDARTQVFLKLSTDTYSNFQSH